MAVTSGLIQRKVTLVALFLINFVVVGSLGSTCSWSNEGCSEDKDCCSKSCHRAFEGVNPRCRHSTIGEQCIFSYHCGYDLDCGPHFNCCAPYWKMCTKDEDCCDPQHICRPADGFYYDRCLYASAETTFGLTALFTIAASVGLSLLMWL